MGHSPLNDSPSIQHIQNYLWNLAINTLDQISNWDENSKAWIGWVFPNTPPHLEVDLVNLKATLHGISPLVKGRNTAFGGALLGQHSQ